MNFRKIVSLLCLGVLCVTVSACAPRGETQSLAEILEQSRNRYRAALVGKEATVPPMVGDVATRLSKLEQGAPETNIGSEAQAVTQLLSELTNHSGYTSRPALAEITSQYRVLAASNAAPGNSATVKLLVARTYVVLASELETTRFAL